MKPWHIVLAALVIIVVTWLTMGIARVIRAENDVVARFDELVAYYVGMGPAYVEPMISRSDLTEGDRMTLVELQESLEKLGAMDNRDEQFEALRLVQKKTLEFFASTAIPESVAADRLYLEWGKNSANFGEASGRLKTYNDALGSYNALGKSSAGKIIQTLRSWNHHQYLRIDGELEGTPQVSF